MGENAAWGTRPTDPGGIVSKLDPARFSTTNGPNVDEEVRRNRPTSDYVVTTRLLKGSQTDYTNAVGRRALLRNSVTEAGIGGTDSRLTCHSRKTATAQGTNVHPLFGKKSNLPLTGISQMKMPKTKKRLIGISRGVKITVRRKATLAHIPLPAINSIAIAAAQRRD